MKALYSDFVIDAAFKDGLSTRQILSYLRKNGAADVTANQVNELIAAHRKKYFRSRPGLRVLGRKVTLLSGDKATAVAISRQKITVRLKDKQTAKLDLSAVSLRGRSLDSWAKERNYRLY